MMARQLAHFRILQQLGSGGMGVVYKARDLRLDRDVAIKVVRPEALDAPGARERFLREARAASALNHPNVVTIHAVDQADDQDFIVMELVEGTPLDRLIPPGGLAVERALDVATQIADGLAAAHARGLVHRDLKPGNVVVTTDGRAKILDFGLAKHVAGSADPSRSTEEILAVTAEGTVLGTPRYMSPEQARGRPLDPRSDVFSFGSLLYEMLTGEAPFRGESAAEVLGSVLRDTPPPPSARRKGVPAALDALVAKALEKDPAYRYASGGDVLTDLRRMRRDSGGTSAVAAPVPGRRRRLASIRHRTGPRSQGKSPRRKRAGGRKVIRALAVLPLANLSRDSEQEYFADGMTEALIADLAKLPALRVISRTSAMRYKATDKSLPEIAGELNVDGVVEGSVLRVGDRVRITAELIHATTDTHLWAESYERELQDVLVLQREVAQAIAKAINVALSPEDRRRFGRARPVNPGAFEAYLKGRFHWYKLSPVHFQLALEYFQRALEKDPDYAPAYAAVADAWGASGVLGVAPPREIVPKVKAAVAKAIELDDTLAEAHDILGRLKFFYEWDWEGAERCLQRAIVLNPNYADAHVFHSFLLHSVGRPEEGMAEIRRALELDPLNSFFQAFLGRNLLYMHRYDEAMAQLCKVLAAEPDLPIAHQDLWGALHLQRKHEEALAGAKRYFAALGNGEAVEALGRGEAEGGYLRAMSLAGETLAARSGLTYVQATQIAALFACGGQKPGALDWLVRAHDERDPGLVDLRISWQWDGLRDEPRFQDLLRRMNFAE